jgi:hypothetical protein
MNIQLPNDRIPNRRRTLELVTIVVFVAAIVPFVAFAIA